MPRQDLACPNWGKVATSFQLLNQIDLTDGLTAPCTLPNFTLLPAMSEIALSDNELTGANSHAEHSTMYSYHLFRLQVRGRSY